MPGVVKISQLPPATTVNPSDVLPLVDAGTTVGATAQQVYGANRREGQQTLVPADGSASVAVPFAPPFPNGVLKVDCPCFTGYNGSDFPVFGYSITAITASGFTLTVGGGQSGKTVTVHFGASGF